MGDGGSLRYKKTLIWLGKSSKRVMTDVIVLGGAAAAVEAAGRTRRRSNTRSSCSGRIRHAKIFALDLKCHTPYGPYLELAMAGPKNRSPKP